MPPEGNDNQPKKFRISLFMATLMIGLALLMDGAQFLATFLFIIPVLGWAAAIVIPLFITILSYIIFGIWLALLHVNFFKGKQAAKKIISILGSFVVEVIPFLESIPTITGGVVMMIIATYQEDFAEGAQPTGLMKAATGAIKTGIKVAAPEAIPAMEAAEKATKMAAAVKGTSAQRIPPPANDNKQMDIEPRRAA